MTHTHTCPTLLEKWFDGAMADGTFPRRNSRVARRKDLGEGPWQWILGLICGDDFGGGPYLSWDDSPLWGGPSRQPKKSGTQPTVVIWGIPYRKTPTNRKALRLGGYDDETQV